VKIPSGDPGETLISSLSTLQLQKKKKIILT